MKLRFLGGTTIEGTDGPVTGRGVQRARLALLAILALSRSRAASRERLMTVIWPEADTERARHLLRDSIYRLRETLGENCLESLGDDVKLDASRITCDVWLFEEAASRGELALADELYGGPFLDGFHLDESVEFDQWAGQERHRLATLHAHVLERLAEQHGAAGNRIAAIALLRRLVAVDRGNARWTLQLMEALVASGDRSGALRVAAEQRNWLRSEFGVDADPDVERFAERLRLKTSNSLPSPRQADAAPSNPPVIESTTTFEAPALGVAGRWRGSRRRVGMLGLMAVILAASAWWVRANSSDGTSDDLVAVLPVRVSAPGHDADNLREGMVDLAAIFLTGDGIPRAVDTRAMMVVYSRVKGSSAEELTIDQSRDVARELGAGLLLVGDVVVQPGVSTLRARLLEVRSGRVLSEHSETGPIGVRLTTRVIAGVLAKNFGESASRISGLSDSVEAIRAYLRGIQTYRGRTPWASYEHFARAMEIDPEFAAAALWRAHLSWGAFIFGDPEKRRADSVAWALRGRLSRRDSLVLASLPSIGPNYPAPSTARELIEAMERAARANPDRAEVWDMLATHLQVMGSQAGFDGSIERAVAAADRALAIDPDFLSVLSLRVTLALLEGDREGIARHSERFFTALGDTTLALHWRWAVTRALGDSARLPALLQRVAERPGYAWQNVELWAGRYGLSTIGDAERVGVMRLASASSHPDDRAAAARSLFRIATVRGQRSRAIALADSMDRSSPGIGGLPDRAPGAHAWEDLSRHIVIALGIVGPGYDDEARAAVHLIDHRGLMNVGSADLCYGHLWKVTRGDTTGVRRAVARMRDLARTIDPGPSWGVTRLDLCPMLLEAGLEWTGSIPPAHSPALDRVEALLRRGPQAEMPGNLARILVARWRELQGRHADALATLRGVDPMGWPVVAPAAWLAEARVASLAGDVSGAITAYSRYLDLRDSPDAGPIAEEVMAVKRALAALGGDVSARGRVR